MKIINIILIVIYSSFIICAISSEINKVNSFEANKEIEHEKESEANLAIRVQELIKENLLLKQRLLEVNSKINSVEKDVSKQCNQNLGVKNNKIKMNSSNNKIASSFIELKALSKTDPVFKSIVNFPLPREISYLSVSGSNNNKMFSHLKMCPPGCIVGASG